MIISRNKPKFIFLSLITCFFIFFYGCRVQTPEIVAPQLINPNANFEEKVDYSFDLAKYKIAQIISYLEQDYPEKKSYPKITHNEKINPKNYDKIVDGYYSMGDKRYWSAGSFPSLIWLIYQQEKDPEIKKYWRKKAIVWSKPLRKKAESDVGDMAINNLFVFRPWYENSSGREQNKQLQTIFQGAKSLAKPLDKKKKRGKRGRFAEKMGVIGYLHRANKDKKIYWHAFIDHVINVEQLLWSAQHNLNQEEAQKWQNIALTHLKKLAKTMGKNRNPGNSGTWQRAFFNSDYFSIKYGEFLFNEKKQGWRDDTTWSRGQAWWIYATCVAYQYTKDPEILKIAQSAIDYYLNHLPDRFPNQLRREGDLIPPWDFDYALEVDPDTEKDTSASAIAVAGILKLVTSLPPENPLREKYLQESKLILEQLMSPQYLAKPDQGMSILLHGCYVHYQVAPKANLYDNGLIWGDYFFVDALKTYLDLKKYNSLLNLRTS